MKTIIIAAAATLATASSAQGTIYETPGGWNYACIGTGRTCANNFGQTFMALDGATALTSSTFHLRMFEGNSINYAFRIYAWNGYSQTGNALYDSGARTLSGSAYQAVTVTPNISLVPAAHYVALIATSGLGNGDDRSLEMEVALGNPYAPGQFGYQRTDGVSNWTLSGGYDARMRLALSDGLTASVPEPSTWGMALIGFGAIGGLLRRRKRPAGAHGRRASLSADLRFA